MAGFVGRIVNVHWIAARHAALAVAMTHTRHPEATNSLLIEVSKMLRVMIGKLETSN